jgi:hypothetical protein
LDHGPISAVHDPFSIYSQQKSISGGRLPHPQPENASCNDDRGSLKIDINELKLQGSISLLKEVLKLFWKKRYFAYIEFVIY